MCIMKEKESVFRFLSKGKHFPLLKLCFLCWPELSFRWLVFHVVAKHGKTRKVNSRNSLSCNQTRPKKVDEKNTHLVPNNQKCQPLQSWHGHPHLPKVLLDQNQIHEAPNFHQGEYCWILCHDELSSDNSHGASMQAPEQNLVLFLNEHSSLTVVLLGHVLKK